MDDNRQRRNRLIALLLTLLLVVGTVLLMWFTGLHYEWPPRDAELITQLKQDTILFGGEFVMLGDMPDALSEEQPQNDSPEQAENIEPEPTVEGDDIEDSGEPAKVAKPVVTTPEPSPMKVKEKPKEEKKPEKTGPKKDVKQDDKQEKVKRDAEAATNNRVKGAFGKSGNNSGAQQGSPGGNSDTGATTGKPGIGGLVGYTLEKWGRPHSRWVGKVQVRVRVNTRGKVIEAHAVGGSGEAWSHPEVRRSCESAALESAFSVPKNTTTEGVGTIIWSFI